ncbi:HEAT repeat domain-containing protein [Streptomyces nigra]|uniref:HEAT repeat domain-containing protein n=1 Tax=Streptomyces nigra TaxID=1827580 RepID=UPI0037FA1466
MTALPDWMRPPREEGWSADDLDHLPEAPRHTELIAGGGVVGQEEDRVGDLPQPDDASGPSYDARAELIDIGPDAIPALIGGRPSLGGFGQLTAIEVFEEVADPRCGPALIALVGSDDSTVREWAATALASLKIDGAHAQVILYSQFWRVDTGRTYGVPGPGLDWELDWIDRTDLHPER